MKRASFRSVLKKMQPYSYDRMMWIIYAGDFLSRKKSQRATLRRLRFDQNRGGALAQIGIGSRRYARWIANRRGWL